MLFDVCQLSCSPDPKSELLPALLTRNCWTQSASGMIRRPPPLGEFGGVAMPTFTLCSWLHERTNSPGVPIAAMNVRWASDPSLQRMW